MTTLSTPQAAPVIAETWLRTGKTGSGRGAAPQVKQAITTARAGGASGKIMLRGDSAFGNKKVIAACLDEQVEFSLTMSRNRRIAKAIEAIADDAWTPVHYPGAVAGPGHRRIDLRRRGRRNQLHPDLRGQAASPPG